jgi:exopolyphosphatase/guanosine-5'-triphosphate,3'-diphosphate pyrophosphatase
MTIATIDVGTNTALLLVAEIDAEGVLAPVYEARRFVRLGEGVDASRRISAAAMQRLRAALLDYCALARAYEADAIIVGATSASRDAQNKDEVIDFVRRETGLRYEVLSGLEEASWSFRGALSALDDFQGPCAVIDIGGGSTEIVVGDAAGGIAAGHSLDVGSVRLTERYFAGQPPAREAVERAEAFIVHALREAALPLHPAIPLISAAETPLLVALVDRGVSSWDELGRADVVLAAAAVHRWRERLLTMTYDAVMALDPALLAGRADVFPAAVLLFDTVLRHFGLDACRVSPRSLRHGLALRYATRRAQL